MITLTIEQKKNGQWQDVTSKVQYPVSISQRLDRELDGGSFTFISADSTTDTVVFPLTQHRITATDSTGTIEGQFVGASQRALMRNAGVNYPALFKHDVMLTETTKLLEGVLIEGLGVTQPLSGTQKNLLSVVRRLLKNTARAEGTGNGRFQLTSSSDVVAVLQNTESPQFRWSPQTTLWECLLEIASVIDAIPYLDENEKVSFLLLNSNSDEIENLIDEYTYSYGENTNEQQYNSKLSAIVENIKEL